MHGKSSVGYINRSMQDYDRYPFVNKDMKCILHDFDMRCAYETRWQPCGDEDTLLRFYRFEGQPAAIILTGQLEGYRRYNWTLCNGKTRDPYMLVSGRFLMISVRISVRAGPISSLGLSCFFITNPTSIPDLTIVCFE